MKNLFPLISEIIISILVFSPSISFAQNWEIERPSSKEVSRRIIADKDVPFDYKCSSGFTIVSGGYDILGIEGGERSDVRVLASTVDIPNNRYHVKLSHSLPYGGGTHPLVSARISGTCVKSAGTATVPVKPIVPADPAELCVLSKAAIDEGIELRNSSISNVPNGRTVKCVYGSAGTTTAHTVELGATCPVGMLLDFPGYSTSKLSGFKIAAQQSRSNSDGAEVAAILLQPDTAGLRFQLGVMAMCR